MATKFKVGDRVVRTAVTTIGCSETNVTQGEEYEVLGMTPSCGNLQLTRTQLSEGHGWPAIGFELATTKLTKLTIDFTKPLQTVDGRPVALITTEGRGEYPVVGYIGDFEGTTTWTLDGDCYIGDDDLATNLVNVVEKHTVWLNVYKDFNAVHGTYQSAYNASQTLGKPDKQLLARKRVEVVVGEFDNEGTV